MALFASISVNVHGEGVREFAVQAIERIDDLRPAWAVVGENIRKFEEQVFDSEGAALLGSQWKPLAPRTVTARTRGWGYYRDKGRGNESGARRILHWRHEIRESLINANHRAHIESASQSTLIFGTAVEHARYHRESRKFLGLTDEFVKTGVVPPIAQFLMGRDPRSGQGQRSTRRAGRITQPLRVS
jgi:hypothetical protein